MNVVSSHLKTFQTLFKCYFMLIKHATFIVLINEQMTFYKPCSATVKIYQKTKKKKVLKHVKWSPIYVHLIGFTCKNPNIFNVFRSATHMLESVQDKYRRDQSWALCLWWWQMQKSIIPHAECLHSSPNLELRQFKDW